MSRHRHEQATSELSSPPLWEAEEELTPPNSNKVESYRPGASRSKGRCAQRRSLLLLYSPPNGVEREVVAVRVAMTPPSRQLSPPNVESDRLLSVGSSSGEEGGQRGRLRGVVRPRWAG